MKIKLENGSTIESVGTEENVNRSHRLSTDYWYDDWEKIPEDVIDEVIKSYLVDEERDTDEEGIKYKK